MDKTREMCRNGQRDGKKGGMQIDRGRKKNLVGGRETGEETERGD